MQVTITDIKRTERISKKYGSTFISISLRTREHGDKFISGIGNANNKDWKIGDTVEITTYEKAGSDGKIYLHFETPKTEGRTDTGGLDTSIRNLTFKLTNALLIIEKTAKEVTEIKDHLSGKYPINNGNPRDFSGSPIANRVELRDASVDLGEPEDEMNIDWNDIRG